MDFPCNFCRRSLSSEKIKSSDDRFACVRCCAEAVFRKYFILQRDFLFIQFAAQDLAHTYIK